MKFKIKFRFLPPGNCYSNLELADLVLIRICLCMQDFHFQCTQGRRKVVIRMMTINMLAISKKMKKLTTMEINKNKRKKVF